MAAFRPLAHATHQIGGLAADDDLAYPPFGTWT